MNCLLLQRLEACAEECGFDRCKARADWKLVYRGRRYYVCDRHLNAGEKSVHEQLDTHLKGRTDGKN